MANLSEVAKHAGVSPTTVSRYLNHNIALPEETRGRIDAAVKELNYRPNLLAQRLSKGKSEAICLVTPEIANPFFAELAATVEQEAAKLGYSVYFVSTGGEKDKEKAAFGYLADRHADGLILMTNHADTRHLEEALKKNSNVVVLDEAIQNAETPTIVVDNAAGTYLATKHLIELGHSKIAFVGGPRQLFSVEERLSGYLKALAEFGLHAPDSWILCEEYSEEFGFSAGNTLLANSELPTSIVGASDYLVLGMIRAFRKAGLTLPQDMSVVGFDNIPFGDLIDPPLTTVQQPVAELGARAVKTLISVLKKEPVAPLSRLPVELVIRNSTCQPKGDKT